MAANAVSAVRDATGELARFVGLIGPDTLAPGVSETTKVVLADTLAVMLRASREPAVRAAAAAFPLPGKGECTVVGVGFGATPTEAALINGIGGHDIELDDVHTSSRTHPASVVVPAALAAAESRANCAGSDLIAGIIAGYEVECRVSKAMRIQPQFDKWFHPSGVCGAVGAAAAAARTLSLTQEQTRVAIALGAAQASGLMTFEEDPSHMLKSFNTGHAARSGVTAALLAANGYQAAPDVLTGRHNMLIPYGPAEPDYDRLVVGLGESYEISGTSLKRHACCSQTHAAVDGLLAIMDEHDLEAGDIQSIDVQLAHDALAMIDGNDLWTHNIQFIVALAAHEKSVQREHFVPEWTANGAILDLATRVVLTGNDALQQRFPGMQGAWLRLATTDGASFEIEVPAPIGTPDQPMTPEVLKEKFDALAGSVLSGAQASRLWQLTAQLDELTDLSELFSLLACPEQ